MAAFPPWCSPRLPWRQTFKLLQAVKLHKGACAVRLKDCRGYVTHTVLGSVSSERVTFSDGHGKLYATHIPTTALQKSLLTVLSAAASLLDPSRDDMISAMGEASGHCALKRLHQKMQAHPVGQQILREKPVISTHTVDLTYLQSLPEESFGKAYWKFLNKNGFDPDARRPVTFVDDVELAYVMLRYRQIHDLMHTILGMKPNMLGEVAVKWVEAIQTGLPMCIAAAIGGPVRLGPVHRRRYIRELLPWAIRNGLQADFLMAVYYEKMWEMPLKDLRQQLSVIEPTVNAMK